jgi:hypothetical protein
MTAARLIKAAVIFYLGECELDEDISIVDADARAEIELPTLTVAVESMEPHSIALNMVHRAEVSITLRSHPGDDTETEIQTWSDQIESALHDSSGLAAVFSNAGITVYEWTYAGAETEWDEATSEVTFSASILVQRQG